MLPTDVRVWLAVAPVSMVKSIDGLLCAASEQLKRDPHEGVFVFTNHKRDRAKLLWRDASGWCLLYKRLDEKVLPSLHGVEVDGALRIDARALATLLEGVVRPRRKHRVDAQLARRKALRAG